MDGSPLLDAIISLEEKIRMVDRSIKKQQNAIDKVQAPLLSLKSRRNSLVPISRIPPEILCNIFSFSQDLDPDLIPFNLETKCLKWINLTYVCRYWRDVALNAPSLWAEPPMIYPKWVEEMLRRSKECSLVILAHQAPMERGIFLAIQHIHRIRVLSIQNIWPSTWNTLQELLSKAAPRLERLSLVGAHFLNTGIFGIGPLVISKDILSTTERLRQLELKNCALDWDLHFYFFRSLTHLSMTNISQSSPPTGKQFADALKSMLTLEVLTLQNSLPKQTEQQSSWESENIHLGHLQTLSIDSVSPEVEAFFRYVTFPSITMVKIVCRDNGLNANLSDAMIALARSYSNIAPDITFRSLIQGGANGREIRLMFSTEVLKYDEALPHANIIANLNLELYCDSGPQANRQLMNDIFNSGIPLHDINCIFILQDLPGLDAETIANTLGKLPRVHSVVAAGSGARLFFDAAMHLGSDVGDVGGSDETAIQKPYFPCVTSISLHDADFTDPPELLDLEEISTNLLHAFLFQRCELGPPIETLLLRTQQASFRDIKLLEEIVVNVDWNTTYEDWIYELYKYEPIEEDEEGEDNLEDAESEEEG